MRKLPLILAGAALFDLGTVVVSSHAAVALNFAKIEIDYTHTIQSCLSAKGTVVTADGKKFCQTSTASPQALTVTKQTDVANPNLATKAPAKKEEAKKE